MATMRKHYGKWQTIVRIKGHPVIYRSFDQKTDAKRWSADVELKIRREDAGVAKIKFPTFHEAGLRYISDVSITKRGFRNERNIIKSLFRESWSEYPLNKISPNVVGKYRDEQLKTITGSSVNRKLDVVSTIFTTCKKEWGYPVDNPVLSIRRPKKAEPRNRRFSDKELDLLIKGNRTSEVMRSLIQIALETSMRESEILGILPHHLKGATLYIPVAKTKPRLIPLTQKAVALIKSAPLPFNITGDSVGKRFRILCKHYKIKDAVFHDIRKNSLTNFILKKKLSVPETMLISGHSDPRMLLSVYNNLQIQHVAEKLK